MLTFVYCFDKNRMKEMRNFSDRWQDCTKNFINEIKKAAEENHIRPELVEMLLEDWKPCADAISDMNTDSCYTTFAMIRPRQGFAIQSDNAMHIESIDDRRLKDESKYEIYIKNNDMKSHMKKITYDELLSLYRDGADAKIIDRVYDL